MPRADTAVGARARDAAAAGLGPEVGAASTLRGVLGASAVARPAPAVVAESAADVATIAPPSRDVGEDGAAEWLHGTISAAQAELLLASEGAPDGAFILAERGPATFAVCFTSAGRVCHRELNAPAADLARAVREALRCEGIDELLPVYPRK